VTGSTPIGRIAAAFADRYTIVREIGAGGMATVYLAEDLKHRRQVALKVLRPELAATMGPERFFREIEVAARLQHPHILPLHDSGEADGFLFFVMPFVSGESLRERIDRVGELPINDAVRILLEVADALSYSHAQGVVHRDIKPDNVMISGRHALVTDFGVAKAVSESAAASKVTTAGVALGTPAYMAPEQASADAQMDHRVDIYAVGALAYELLTGQTPFAGMPPQKMLMAHVTMAPDPVRKHREACSPELEAIVMKCLAKRPADRWQTADELLDALEPLSASSGGITPTQTRPATTGVTAPAASVPRMRVAIGVVAVAVMAGGAWFALLRDKPETAPVLLERTQLTSTGNAFGPAISPDGSRIAYGERVCPENEMCTIDLHVQDINGAGSATVARGLVGFGALEWSSDGRWLVFNGSTNDRWGSYAVPVLGGTLRYLGCCDVTMAGAADTVVLIDVPQPGKSQTVRWATVPDGVVRDSMVFKDWTALVAGAWDVPRTGRVIVTAIVDDRVFFFLTDRDGNRLDSIPATGHNVFPRLRAIDGGFVLTKAPASGSGTDVVMYTFDGTDRFDRRSTLLAQNVLAPGGLHVGRNGDIVVADGANEFAIWALQRTSLSSMQFTQRLVTRSTSEVMGSITSDGEQLLLLRRRPNTPNVRELSTVPFSGSAEKHLASQPDVLDWDLAQNGNAVVVVIGNGRDSSRIVELSIPEARSRQLKTVSAETRSLETMPGGGFVYARGARGLGLMGVPGRKDTLLTVPTNIGAVEFLEPSPDGKYVAVYAWDTRFDTLFLHRMSVADLSWEVVAPFGGEGAGAPTWLSDGSTMVPVRESAISEAWYRLAPGSRTPVRLGFAPRADASFRFSRNGLRGVAREGVLRPDVYILRGLGAAIKR
jgi:tRNA A-37 threonylcarbamoyl transferase component Bud32